MQAKQLCFLAFGLLLFGMPSVQAQTAFLSFDSAVVETGERIKAHLLVKEKAPERVHLENWEPFFPKENQLSQSPWKPTNQGWEATLEWIAFDSATLELPPLAIQLSSGETVQTNTARLTVIATPIPSNNLKDLSDIKEIHPEPKNWSDYKAWIWALIILIIVAVLVFFLQKILRKTGDPLFRSTQLSPKELATRKLDLLEKQAPWQSGQLQSYYASLSEIVRTFLSDQYNCNAIHLGDEAVIRLLADLPLSSDQQTVLQQLLKDTALAKFANRFPEEQAHPEALRKARAALLLSDASAPEPFTST